MTFQDFPKSDSSFCYCFGICLQLIKSASFNSVPLGLTREAELAEPRSWAFKYSTSADLRTRSTLRVLAISLSGLVVSLLRRQDCKLHV